MSSSVLHVILGTGPSGLSILDALKARNDKLASDQKTRIRTVNRSGKVKEDVPADVEVMKGNVTDANDVARVVEGARVVYAAVNAPNYHKWPVEFPPLQTAILEGCVKAAVPRLVVLDNLYAYGPHQGRTITETMPHKATDDRGVTRVKLASQLKEYHNAGKIKIIVARASDFFGPRVLQSQAGDRFMYPIIGGSSVQFLGDPDQPHAITYIGDLGRAMVTLAFAPDSAYGEDYIVPSHNTSFRALAEAVAKEAGTKANISSVKKGFLRTTFVGLLSVFVPPVRGIEGLSYQFDEAFTVDTAKYVNLFGDDDRTPLEAAVNDAVAWYKAHAQ
ncbi:NAD(P)-binding protein [Gonapodya prolifera JEL478]|uniref:NAD(P)-binding protein n=1 Tax=Gonapodya prolifera (strain JEL478) TaxID=1344416 RepID=A0A139AWG7_GONPJ|nr:NAD(P)-binding protein [Gonapodya prolifera JEL478]|eukprot:KXS21091.1 NAD(P)-binding protein [Gonapodya prolifera JEL478]